MRDANLLLVNYYKVINLMHEGHTVEQKIETIIKNVDNLPTSLRNVIANWLKTHSTGKQSDETERIRIETFYRMMQSGLINLDWGQPNQEVKYPVTAVIVDINEQAQGYLLGVKISTWIESGGTRIIPIKSSAPESEIQKTIKLSHCAIFSAISRQSQQYKNFVQAYIKMISEQSKYPLLFLGKSCSAVLCDVGTMKLIPSKINFSQSEQFISYSSQLFKGLDLGLRVQIENRKRINYPFLKVAVNEISLPTFYPIAYMKTNNEIVVNAIQSKQKHIYLLINEPTFENQQNIQLWHNVILNFIDTAKSSKKQIDEKKVEKKLLAHHKIIHKAPETYYLIQ